MATPVSNSVPLLTGSNNNNGSLTEEFISGLVQGSSWTFGGGPRNLTYSFSKNDTLVSEWAQEQKSAFVQALAGWSNVANITFSEAGSGTEFLVSSADIAATLTFNELQGEFNAIGLGFFPDPVFVDLLLIVPGDPYSRATWPRPEGDVFFDDFMLSFTPGSSGFEVMLHELGHALGLKHTNDDGENGRPTFSQLGIGTYDTTAYTLMGGGSLGPGPYAVTPMLADILAIQHIYGANTSYHTGDDTYVYSSASYRTIWDAGGTDTLDASGAFIAMTIDLRPGQLTGVTGAAITSPKTAIAFGVTIENAVGTNYNDTITGNDAANVLDGGLGADTLAGGLGNDTYIVRTADDVVIENPGEGTDTVLAWFSYSIALLPNLENLTLHETEIAFNGTGNAGSNIIMGNAARNFLDGRGGADTLIGAGGSDSYVVDDIGDVVVESAGPDIDVVLSSVSYALSANVEVLTLSGTSNINGTGSNGDDSISGNPGNNVLDGGGGADRLNGGGGSDTYIVDNSGDTVTEGALSTTLVSSSSDGTQGSGNNAVISDNGRFVAFLSFASNFVSGAGFSQHVYVKDLQTGGIALGSSASNGEPANS